MNLQHLIEQFIAFRQALGERFGTNAKILRAFGRAVGVGTDVTAVRIEQVNAFLAGAGPLTSSWHCRHSVLRGFYRYALSRGYVVVAPLPAVVPKRPAALTPYI